MVARKKKKTTDRSEDTTPADMADSGATEGPNPEAAAAEGPEDDVSTQDEPTTEEVIAALTDEVRELEDRHLRLVAEFDNYRKRTARERELQTERAQADLVKELLESLDDLSRVSQMSSKEHEAGAIVEGVQLVEDKLRRVLRTFGLQPIEAEGRPFNPELHEALVTVATDDPEEDDTVSQEIARGYLFKDALLRPALVEVKKYRPGEAESEK
ncbi:MAG: nucleotide exchange factor GrpE [Gemmatimonadetes bacterium]|uniref:Protein GrpE n=1 Tax=Candidatus Kutchimonas denitrificans TaxID=3056748 RepID=A0AAE4Z7E4_9BACT|nr:nucleotide exchange factor GrpE [Gemmatimonadota bacterium]NIR74978.1 nucleotide exchange factor GrpE [Candidatus Kutchimonas denitrificans]NIS01561.1 nucleotide exchange factor GrpE [Gemmatimonadota bacterium]NIT67299.1 nucleotide exchange factor GrpE [Gemmatimonadota bacterium]NIU52662.1 nucleotide exchange factor GrpE [Gemmatimonadota bacterium]